MIVLQHVTKVFGTNPLLVDVSFRIDPGEFVCVSGPGGSGKTTLLSLILGTDKPTEGLVEIDGVDLRKIPPVAIQLFRRRVGIMFQDGKLIPHATVEENVRYPLDICGFPEDWSAQRVAHVLALTGLSKRAQAFPWQLSAGEKARVGLARAFVHEPLIIIADEPTGNLDPEEAGAVINLLQQLHASGTTVILLTHDNALVDVLQTRVVRLESGRIIRDSVGGYDRPKRVQPKSAAAQAKHEFFGDEHPDTVARAHAPDEELRVAVPGVEEEPEPIKAAAPVTKPAKKSGRKVHITSINS